MSQVPQKGDIKSNVICIDYSLDETVVGTFYETEIPYLISISSY